jgi:hypothetical protein
MPVAIALFLLASDRLATCLATSGPITSPGGASENAGASPTEIRVLIAH